MNLPYFLSLSKISIAVSLSSRHLEFGSVSKKSLVNMGDLMGVRTRPLK